jgi:hypothetical protein
MTEVHFYITKEKIEALSVADFEAFERVQDGDTKIYRLRPAMCQFMVDENNVTVPIETALKITEKFSMGQLKEFVEQFFEAIKLASVPKANGSPS